MVHLTRAIEFNKRRHLVAPADAGRDKLTAVAPRTERSEV
jgi:hypothetical protein